MIIDINVIIGTFSFLFVGLYFLYLFGLKVELGHSTFDGFQSRVSVTRLILFTSWSGFMIYLLLESFGAIDTIPNVYGKKIVTSIIISSALVICAMIIGIKENKKKRPK